MFHPVPEISRDMFVTPMYDIDLLWHTHQLHPLAYAADMTSWLGYVLNHDDTDQDRDVGSKLSNVRAWTSACFCNIPRKQSQTLKFCCDMFNVPVYVN